MLEMWPQSQIKPVQPLKGKTISEGLWLSHSTKEMAPLLSGKDNLVSTVCPVSANPIREISLTLL